MRKLLSFFLLAAFVAVSACEGPMGPPGLTGPQGPQGQPGADGLIGEVYELEPVNLTAANNFSVIFTYPSPIFNTDKVLTYFLWDVDGDTDIWRLLPQTIFVPQGIFQYNYDFTRFDTKIFLEGNFPLIQIGNEFTRDLIFRIVIIPADFDNSRIDYNDYNGVMNLINAKESDVIKVKAD
jgi:hypothetical protein